MRQSEGEEGRCNSRSSPLIGHGATKLVTAGRAWALVIKLVRLIMATPSCARSLHVASSSLALRLESGVLLLPATATLRCCRPIGVLVVLYPRPDGDAILWIAYSLLFLDTEPLAPASYRYRLAVAEIGRAHV